MDEEAHDEYCRFMFKRVMEYLINKKTNYSFEAGCSFASDCNKSKLDLGGLGLFLFKKENTAEDVIKLVCGYSFMPKDLRLYYEKPEKAFEDYSK